MRETLADLFSRTDHSYDELHNLVTRKLKKISRTPTPGLLNTVQGAMAKIDLQGRTFILDRPLQLPATQLVILCHGSLIAGPSFPKGKYLIEINQPNHGVQLKELFLECSKRANGIFLGQFFRTRIEDCYIIHQLSYGIYSSPTGGNHELEVIKCHISEFLFGDGYPKKKACYGIIPQFDIDSNRISTGIYLGQADNVVADCNINLCRVGIFSGMRANRIHGNHITAGGSKNLEIFKGIELNNHHKSSAFIVNNYIDNCCLWINCDDDKKKNLRNYFHITDNLFYRGYNHPLEQKEEFHHIIIKPLKKASLLANLHICDNNFYNQPENLNGIKPRVIKPIHVITTNIDKETESICNLDHSKLIGVSVINNNFTNCYPTFVVPMGSEIIKEIIINPEQDSYRVNFEQEIALGNINTAKVSIIKYEGKNSPSVNIKKIEEREVILNTFCTQKAKIQIEISTHNPYTKRFPYIVK